MTLGSTRVLVPHALGRLADVDRPRGRSRDELDDLVDDMFPETDEGPGLTDAALFTTGAAATAWALFAGGPAIALAGGCAALVISLALPAKALVQRLGDSATKKRERALEQQGTMLALDTDLVQALATRYSDLFTRDPAGEPTMAAHDALIEVATLLAGRSPDTAAEIAYVEIRSAALGRLLALPRLQESNAMIEARDEIDKISGTGSLDRISKLEDERGTA